MNRPAFSRILLTLLMPVLVAAAACGKKSSSFDVRDVDPGRAGDVRTLGPESQDAIRVAELMARSLLASPTIASAEAPPTIAVLPMVNNTRFPFNQEVFTTRLNAELTRNGQGRMRFIARDLLGDIETEREMKREGEVDYDPARRTRTVAGADYFLAGRVEGLSTASRQGQSEYAVYYFRLVDTETGIELWGDVYEIRREGRDDTIYR